jgi:hypothetical protein
MDRQVQVQVEMPVRQTQTYPASATAAKAKGLLEPAACVRICDFFVQNGGHETATPSQGHAAERAARIGARLDYIIDH